MKKNQHVVYSTKKVAKRAARQQQQQQQADTDKRTAPTTTTTTAATVRSVSAPTTTTTATTTTAEREVRESSDHQQTTKATTPTRMHRNGSSGTRSHSTGGGDATPSRSQSSRRSSPHSQKRKKSIGSSSKHSLKPASALLQSEQSTVAQCVRSMIDKKTDATLLLDNNGLLTGILTDRDIAFKVVAVGKNPKFTRVCDVMTPNPSCVASNASAIDALKQMVSGQFRHLPVTDNEKVVGILDIAKCLYDAISKIESGYELSPDRLSEALKKLFLPTLSAIITEGSTVPIVGPASTALQAAQLMLEKKTSAVMVCNDAGEMVGIFTSKDLMRRVVAVGIEPQSTPLLDVMTHNPYSATLGTTILETLHSMHNGRFLHVPVFDENVKLVGLVDVLQVTCGVVQQMGTFQKAKNDNVQPLWDRFRSSLHHTEDQEDSNAPDSEAVIVNNESELEVDSTPPEESREPIVGQQTWDEFVQTHNVLPHEADPSDPSSTLDNPAHDEITPNVFVYKLADCYGTNHRFTSSAESLKDLIRDVQNRLGDHTIRKVHYVDDEGDHVLLFKDDDLKDAVNRAKMWGNKYIRLIVPYRVSRIGERGGLAARHAFAHANESALGMVYYAAAAAAIAGASFFLSRRR
ncbi:Myosin-like protein, partial [Globisporangium splendens]